MIDTTVISTVKPKLLVEMGPWGCLVLYIAQNRLEYHLPWDRRAV